MEERGLLFPLRSNLCGVQKSLPFAPCQSATLKRARQELFFLCMGKTQPASSGTGQEPAPSLSVAAHFCFSCCVYQLTNTAKITKYYNFALVILSTISAYQFFYFKCCGQQQNQSPGNWSVSKDLKVVSKIIRRKHLKSTSIYKLIF